jgi:phosphohistidine phosphatase SixA
MKNACLLLLLFVFLVGCTSTFYLVRHAERLDNSADSPLSAAGFARANALRDSLLDKDVDSVLATPYLRTQQTAQPLATALGKSLSIYSTDTTWQFAAGLKKIKGKDLLVVGHSNTIPEIVLAMTGDSVSIAHDDYDNLFVVKIRRCLTGKKVRLIKKTYGAASP